MFQDIGRSYTDFVGESSLSSRCYPDTMMNMKTPKKRKHQVKAGPRQFVVVLTPEKGGWYSVTCPSLPGCHSQGKGISQALANIREAIELVIEDMVEHGEPLPATEALLATVQI